MYPTPLLESLRTGFLLSHPGSTTNPGSQIQEADISPTARKDLEGWHKDAGGGGKAFGGDLTKQYFLPFSFLLQTPLIVI